MKTTAFILPLLAVFPFPFGLAGAENLPGVEPSVFKQIELSRKTWEEAQEKYMESMTAGMKRLEEEIDSRTKRLVDEELPHEERKEIYEEIKALEERLQHLDDEENMLQAASIVKWANRKEELKHFLSSSKSAVIGATGLGDGR